MSHNHSEQQAHRLAVIVCGERNRNPNYERALKKQAAAEALSLLERASTDSEVWSHPFLFEGKEFLLSTIMQSPRDATRRVNGYRVETVRLAPRIVIEVAPMPPGLTKRTLFRPRELPSGAAPHSKSANSEWRTVKT